MFTVKFSPYISSDRRQTVAYHRDYLRSPLDTFEGAFEELDVTLDTNVARRKPKYFADTFAGDKRPLHGHADVRTGDRCFTRRERNVCFPRLHRRMSLTRRAPLVTRVMREFPHMCFDQT